MRGEILISHSSFDFWCKCRGLPEDLSYRIQQDLTACRTMWSSSVSNYSRVQQLVKVIASFVLYYLEGTSPFIIFPQTIRSIESHGKFSCPSAEWIFRPSFSFLAAKNFQGMQMNWLTCGIYPALQSVTCGMEVNSHRSLESPKVISCASL